MISSEILIQNGSTVFAPVIEEDIQWETERQNAPGKLTFKVVKDNTINFTEGNAVRFAVNNTNIFYRFCFQQKEREKRNNNCNSI